MHWFDMKDVYFDAYRAHLKGFFKAPGGQIFKYKETKTRKLYEKPYYSAEDKNYVDEESWKFLFKTNDDMRHCKKILQGMSHSLVQVSVISYFSVINRRCTGVYFLF